jgi:hypothetical protein
MLLQLFPLVASVMAVSVAFCLQFGVRPAHHGR